MVRDQRSAREITVDQANWVHHRITAGEPVVDVSEANDWSKVRVWWDPTASMGISIYPTYGFITPERRGRLIQNRNSLASHVGSRHVRRD